MQISGAAVCYTHPLTHRRFPPRPTDSQLCLEALGAMITQMAPPISHNKTLDNSVPNSSNFAPGCLFLFSSTETLALSSLGCHLWTRFQTKLSRVRSQNTPTLCSTCSHRPESLFLAALQTASAYPWYLQASLHSRYNNTGMIDRTGRWGNARSRKHTRCSTRLLTQRREFPKACSLQNSGGTTLKPHAAPSNLTHYWLASNLMITPRSSPISSLVPGCNLPKATGLVLAETSSLVPTCICANQRPWQPQASARISHTTPGGRNKLNFSYIYVKCFAIL